MTEQSYTNHRRVHPLFHAVLLPILLLTTIGSIVNLVKSWGDHTRLYSASLIVVLSVCSLLILFLCRSYGLKTQDRAIRAEENLRHLALTGKLLDPRLDIRQTIALRFASDAELPALAARTAQEKLPPDTIKQAIGNWRADTYRI